MPYSSLDHQERLVMGTTRYRNRAEAIVVGVALLFVLAVAGASTWAQVVATPSHDVVWPPLPIVKHPADSAQVIKDTYEFAAAHPEIVRFMPCFCICGKSVHHRSNEDCFISARGRNQTVVWNDHAAECPICLAVAKDSREMFLRGEDVRFIREEIERRYSARFTTRTDTPMPPAKPHQH
jgi:hypothetical protein